jgi:hypothetical protein
VKLPSISCQRSFFFQTGTPKHSSRWSINRSKVDTKVNPLACVVISFSCFVSYTNGITSTDESLYSLSRAVSCCQQSTSLVLTASSGVGPVPSLLRGVLTPRISPESWKFFKDFSATPTSTRISSTTLARMTDIAAIFTAHQLHNPHC